MSSLNDINTISVSVSGFTADEYFSTFPVELSDSVTLKPEASACFLNSSGVTGVRAEHPAKQNTTADIRTAEHNLKIFFNLEPPVIYVLNFKLSMIIIVRIYMVYKLILSTEIKEWRS